MKDKNLAQHRRDLRILKVLIATLPPVNDFVADRNTKESLLAGRKFMIVTTATAMGFTEKQLNALERKLSKVRIY